MNNNTFYISELIQKYLYNGLTDAEQHSLQQWLAADEQHRLTFKELTDEEWLATELHTFNKYDLQAGRRKIDALLAVEKPVTHKVPFLKTTWFRYTAAAILILAIGSGIYYLNNQSSKLPVIIGGTGGTVGTRGDIAPGTNRAILTINNNQNIDLASDKTGININNTVTYNDGEKIADAGQMLQLTTPRGGQYQAVLPDGSKVWLNAASSIKFPSKFNDKERRVEVTGEAYFEIAKDATKPFKVSGGEQEIEVLGTSFNINIYNDEPIKKTTLITGSIKITHNNQTTILQPGQQANISITPITKIKQITVQTNDVIAWKNGIFDFNDLDLHTVMRQLERWYDITVRYEPNTPNPIFKGKIYRNAQLADLLEMLTKMGVHFKTEGRNIIITN